METFFYKLCPKGVIRVMGEDAVDYLQSQCSINLRKLDTGKIRYGLRLSTRGRVLGDSYFLRLDEEEFILLSRECEGTDLLSLLNENIVADEVEFINESNAWELITVWKNGSGNVQLENWPKKPTAGGYIHADKSYFFEDFRISPGTYSILQPLHSKIPQGVNLREMDYDSLQIKRIRAGLVSVPSEIGPTDLPQEGRLELDAVDFDKGCYLGQETMARIHAMGRVRRLSFPVMWNGEELPDLPCNLYDNQKKKGVLKSLIPLGKQKAIGMALIHESADEALQTGGLEIEGFPNGRIQKA